MIHETVQRVDEARHGRPALRAPAMQAGAARGDGSGGIGGASAAATALRGILRRLAGDEIGTGAARPATW